jgi:hypothetical protein
MKIQQKSFPVKPQWALFISFFNKENSIIYEHLYKLEMRKYGNIIVRKSQEAMEGCNRVNIYDYIRYFKCIQNTTYTNKHRMYVKVW